MCKITEVIKQEYNINGIGLITSEIYAFPASLYYDKRLKLKDKMKNINQLGALKYIYKGAHYTRHEYILLQIMLINIIQKEAKNDWGLGSNINFNKLDIKEEITYSKGITEAEMLELIVILANIGHFKDTFASNKVWFHYLVTNRFNLKRSFKKGLSQKGRELFDRILENGDYQKIQWLNSLYILSRNKNFNDHKIICQLIIDKLFGNENEEWANLFDLYYKIRKVSYIVLDSHYSHIPVSISLKSVLFNKQLFIDELSKNNSGLMGTFDRINDLLEDTLYFENNAMLMGTYRSMDIYKKLENYINNEHGEKISISKVTDLLLNEEKSPFYGYFNISNDEIPWNLDKNLSLTFIVNDKNKFPIDVFGEELKLKEKLGKNCFIAMNFSPSFTKFRIVYSLSKSIRERELLSNCRKIISSAIDYYLKFHEYSLKNVNNGVLKEVVIKKIFTYLFRNILKEDYYCNYVYDISLSPFIIGNGSKNTIKKLNEYIEKFKTVNPEKKDQIHELKAVKKSLCLFPYQGLHIVYLGSLRFINSKKCSDCELDGLILTPKNENILLRVIEAKNLRKGDKCRIAKEQLHNKFVKLLPKYVEDIIYDERLPGYGSQIVIKNIK